ncbi:hypothetical protein HRG_012949 [Hirsutella rhossiliensis]
MPALVVRDQGYQPVLPRLLALWTTSLRPAYCFLYRPYHAAQLNCCGFVRLSTYVAPGMPNKLPFKGFHPFQVFVIFPIRANPWAILSKVAGLLRHDVMLYPPGSDRDNVFIVVPDSWTFLDKAAAAVTPMTPLLSTPQRQQASSPSAAFQDMRAASLSLATPGTLPLSPPPLASASPSTGPLGPPGKRCCPEPADTPTKRPRLLHKAPVPSSSPNPGSSATQSFSVSAASLTSKPDSLNGVMSWGLFPPFHCRAWLGLAGPSTPKPSPI